MADRELIKLSKQWNKKVPSKYKHSLINEVHNVVINSTANRSIAANIQLLIHTNYFNHVLWEFFDQDVIVNHIELIAVVCLYELNSGTSDIFNEITTGSQKLDELLVRLLNITFDIRPGISFRLQRMTLQLLRELSRAKSDQLKSTFRVLCDPKANEEAIKKVGPVYLVSNWLKNLVTANIDMLYQNIDDVDYLEYLKAVVLFCFTIRDQYPDCLNTYPLSGFNFQIGYGFREFLKILIPKCEQDYFELFKAHYFGKTPNWNKIILVPTVYDLEESEWFQFVKSLDMDQLKDINTTLNLPPLDKEEPLINSILYYILNWKFHTPKDLNHWNEEELFDRFDYQQKVSFAFNLPVEKTDDYDFSYELRHESFDHVISVLNRLKISLDKANKLQINGKSKYFHSISSIETKGDKSVIDVNGDWAEDNIVILLKIVNPNKYSSHQRVKKYGLEKVAIREVLSVTGNKKTSLVIPETGDQFNYLIRMKSKYFMYFKDQANWNPASFENMKYENPVLVSGGVPSEFFTAEFEVQAPPKRDLKQVSQALVRLDPKIQTCEVIDDNISSDSLSKSEAKAIYESLTNKLTSIDVVPNGTSRLLNSLVSNLRLNFKDQSVLIVTPNSNWARTIQLPSEVNDKTGRLFQDINDMRDPIELIESLLARTKTVATKLGLDQEYFSETVENAISFYKIEVPKFWNEYLQKLNQNADNISQYPFEDVPKSINIQGIVDSYYKIIETGRDLVSLSPILKFPNNEVKIKQYLLMNYHKYVIISQQQLLNGDIPGISNKWFDNIVFIDSSSIDKAPVTKLLNTQYKRVIAMGESRQMNRNSLYYELQHEGISNVRIDGGYTNKELLKVYEKEYPKLTADNTEDKFEFKNRIQIIPVKDSSSQVNVPEAEYCAGFYKYLKTHSKDACVVSNSLYQHALFQEMGIESEDINEMASHDYVIVSCFGYNGIQDLIASIKRARKGVYFVGTIQEPNDIHKGVLEVKRNQRYIKVHEIHELK